MPTWDRRSSLRVAGLLATLWAGPFVHAAHAVTVPGNYPTIQSALDAVVNGSLPDGTIIDVAPGTYQEHLSVVNTAKSFTLRGSGPAGSVVVDAAGAGATALLVFRATGQMAFKNLVFRHGALPSTGAGGGFIIQESAPTLTNCVFELNSAGAGGGGRLYTSNAVFIGCAIRNNTAVGTGGGLLIQAGSRPVFTACTIANNTSGTGMSAGVGGGIQSFDSSPTLQGSHVTGNSSTFAGGGIYHTAPFGSAYGTATLVIQDTEISDNVTTPFTSADNPAEGGGIHIEDNAVASLTRARILRNHANTGGGLNAYRARYDIVDTLIDSNQATGRSDGGIGGGINASSTNVTSPPRPASIVNLTRSLVRNSVSLIGGGIVVEGDVGLPASLTLTTSVVDSNTTQSQGGGVLLNRANMTATNSMITRNSAVGDPVSPFGGGVLLTTSSSAAISGTTIAQNTAGMYGGGLFMDGGTSLQMSGSQLYGNSANSSVGFGGGGIFVGPNGTNSGQVTTSTIADNYHYQIIEQSCPRTTLTYQNNTITPNAGSTDFYFSGCSGSAGASTTLANFESASGGRASGNNANVPRFAQFLAVPGAGTSATLVWSVARATGVTIAGVISSNQMTGSVDVSPASSTTYSLTASTASGSIGPLNATVSIVQPPTGAGHAVSSDFDGDGKAEIAVFRPSNSVWYIVGLGPVTWGGSGDIPLRGDFDGDGKADVAIFRPSSGGWYIINSSTGTGTAVTWGGGADIPVPGDYDGDGKTDIAVFRPSTGVWYIINSSTGTGTAVTWGGGADIPVPGDYDGDGKTDIAVFRPSTSAWYIINSSTGTGTGVTWGGGADIPVSADYDGDGKADIAVFRPSTGTWYIILSSTGAGTSVVWGGNGDIPVPGDYDGDGKTDIAVFRPSTSAWYVIQSTTGTGSSTTWGGVGDVPILKRP
jgi:hypothetical protein